MDESLERKLAIERATSAHREELRRAVRELVHVTQERVNVGINVARHAWVWVFGALLFGLKLGLRKLPEVRR
jgi:hypothetical protein